MKPHGFASTLQTTQNFVTNAWSSTYNCPLFLVFCYDIQTNMTGNGIDSQVVRRCGFLVDTKGKFGLKTQGEGQTNLKESG